MVPVAECHHTEIRIVVGCRRAAYKYASRYAVPCLEAVVTVVPAGTVLGGFPRVGRGLTGCGRTLCDRVNTIIRVVVQLPNTVKM